MWLLVLLWWLGLALQLVGIAIALWGIAANEDEYMPAGERSMLRAARELPGRVGEAGRRVWREVAARVTRRRGVNVGVLDAVLPAITSEIRGTVTVTWRPPPDDATLEERLALAESRLLELHQSLQTMQVAMSEAATKHTQLAVEVTRQADDLRQHADESVGRLATRGVRLAAFGLAVTALGMLASAFGASPLPW